MSILDTDYGFKHAVCLVWHEDGRSPESCKPVKETARARRLACDLLREWGNARGGTPVDSDTEKWDFGRYTGYAMFFAGSLDNGRVPEPNQPTRLQGDGRTRDDILRDQEEHYAITQADLDAIHHVDEPGVIVAGGQGSAYLSAEDLGRLRDSAVAAGMVPLKVISNILVQPSGRYYVCLSNPVALLDALEPEETLACVELGMGSDGAPLYGWTTTVIADL